MLTQPLSLPAQEVERSTPNADKIYSEVLAAENVVTIAFDKLSQRQNQILRHILAGAMNKTIAYELAISERTVESHRATIMRRTGAKSLPELVALVLATTQLLAWRDVAAENLARLTPRQYEIMKLVLAGHPSKNISADLGINQRTVENHRAAIMKRTGAKSLPALTCLAFAAA